ncbi:MAG: AAA family ATPase [Nitrososphaerales archaeon]
MAGDLKIAVAGKGGVGKTTVSGVLARAMARRGYKVLAIDADPAMNLWLSLGVPKSALTNITPLSENDNLIEERTGARPGSIGGVFSLTPKVSDLTDKYGITGPDGVTLLVLGTVKSAGGGCMCPANALLKALLRHLLLDREDVVVLDMEAGLEHLGRGVVKGVDVLLAVVEPSYRSIETAFRVKKLAQDLGVKRVYVIGNKISRDEEAFFVKSETEKLGMNLLANIPLDQAIPAAEMAALSPIDYAPASPAVKAIEGLTHRLKEIIAS